MTLASPPQLILTRDDVVSVAPPLRAINDLIEDTYRLSGLGQAEVPVKDRKSTRLNSSHT